MTGVPISSFACARPDRILGIGVELPELLAGLRLVAADPAVTLRRHDLEHAADASDRRRRPLAVEDAILDRVVLPDQLSSGLVEPR
jgi:hypothetical protein